VTRVAVIDCGTNSLRLLVTDIDGESQRDVDRRLEIVRLGQGVDRTGQFAPEALARTLTVVETYAALIDSLGAKRVRMVATSATRDARDRSSFATRVRSVLGVGPEVISGEEEARLSFAGATRGLPPTSSQHAASTSAASGFLSGTSEQTRHGPLRSRLLGRRSRRHWTKQRVWFRSRLPEVWSASPAR
jgi:exopolyphosphatase / guanosine-5'-triphosphate,3'-diphosphate pyrophosphatase